MHISTELALALTSISDTEARQWPSKLFNKRECLLQSASHRLLLLLEVTASFVFHVCRAIFFKLRFMTYVDANGVDRVATPFALVCQGKWSSWLSERV